MKKSVAFVFGKFNTIHPGHVRLFAFALEKAERLVVGVLADELIPENQRFFSLHERITNLLSHSLVNEVLTIEIGLPQTLQTLRPPLIIVGNKKVPMEYGIDQQLLTDAGSELVTVEGLSGVSTSDILGHSPILSKPSVHSFLERERVDEMPLEKLIVAAKNFSVAVIGDVIIDHYVDCKAIGLSQEDPMVVAKPLKQNSYLGGAGIVACHAGSLGARATLMTVLGDDEEAEFTVKQLDNKSIKHITVVEYDRHTTAKTRYRIGGKTVFRKTVVSEEPLKSTTSESLVALISDLPKHDVVVCNDFDGVVVTPETIKILKSSFDTDTLFVGDSQSSSRKGDLSLFKGFDFLSPTEHEARNYFNDYHSGLTDLCVRLFEDLELKFLIMTLGSDGAMCAERINGIVEVFDIPSFADQVVDVAGAGDSLLIMSAISLAAGASMKQAAVLGTVAASVQLSRVGNVPLEQKELQSRLRQILTANYF